MLTKTFDFLSERARGLLLTLGSTGVGTLPELVTKTNTALTTIELTAIENVQLWAYRASFVVALLTIISYLYKFSIFCKKQNKLYKERKKKV